MISKNKIFVITSSLIFFALVASYVNFVNYRPKVIKQIADVKGLNTEHDSNMPTPEGAEKTSFSRSATTEILTFHINKPKAEIQEFYKNIYTAEKWTLESQGVYSDFIISRYKRNNNQISVITFDTNKDETGYTSLVSLENSRL